MFSLDENEPRTRDNGGSSFVLVNSTEKEDVGSRLFHSYYSAHRSHSLALLA